MKIDFDKLEQMGFNVEQIHERTFRVSIFDSRGSDKGISEASQELAQAVGKARPELNDRDLDNILDDVTSTIDNRVVARALTNM